MRIYVYVREDPPMLISHGSTCLRGPVSHADAAWRRRRALPARPQPEIRHGLVARVRAEIAAGTYDTPERFDAALDRLAERLGL